MTVSSAHTKQMVRLLSPDRQKKAHFLSSDGSLFTTGPTRGCPKRNCPTRDCRPLMGLDVTLGLL